MTETTAADFSRFETAVRADIDLLGLKDWLVHVQHAPVERPVHATLATDHVGRVALITFNKHADAYTGSCDPVRTARHEALELLLSPLVRLANSRYALPEDIETETHAIIRRLERLNLS